MRGNKRGITLIALVITIVVLLILAGVTISALFGNNGIINQAEKAGEIYKSKAEDEANSGEIIIDGKKYDSIEDYLEKKEETTAIHNWKRTGDQLTCTHCNITLAIGQEVNYTKTGNESSSINEEKSGIAQAKADEWNQATDIDTQTVNKDSNTKWVVLGIEDTDGDKVNETLLITTETPTTDEIMLYGAAAYNNCVDEINRMCRELYGEEARGITIDDVNNCLGYTKSGGMYRINGVWKTTGNLTTKIKNIEEIWTKITNNNINNKDGLFYDPKNPNGIKDKGAILGEYELNGYFYYISDDGTYIEDITNKSDKSNTITSAAKTLISGTDSSYCYWMASKSVNVDSDQVCFGLDTVDWGSIGLANTFSSGDFQNLPSFPLRAVVSIKSDIPTVVVK